jgi:hypothetical protein
MTAMPSLSRDVFAAVRTSLGPLVVAEASEAAFVASAACGTTDVHLGIVDQVAVYAPKLELFVGRRRDVGELY